MANGVATKAGARRAGFKFSLTHAQVMQLSTSVVPEVVGGGRIKLVPRPKDDLGKPYFVFYGTVAERVAALGIANVHLSITHDAGVAAAMVVCES